jgi:hypothetical protein
LIKEFSARDIGPSYSLAILLSRVGEVRLRQEEDLAMKKFAISTAAVSVLAFTFVSLVPQPADAGWRRKAWRHSYAPGVNVYVGPRYGYYEPRRYYRGCGYYGCGGYPYAYYPYWRKRYWRGWY